MTLGLYKYILFSSMLMTSFNLFSMIPMVNLVA